MTRGPHSPRRLLAIAGPSSSTWRLKKILLLLILVGGMSYIASAGTFAIINTTENNHGATVASGTLTFNNTVDAGTTCTSWGSGSSDNENTGCQTLSGLSTAAAITVLPVAALTAAVTSGDAVKITSGSFTQTFTASATAAIEATSISVTSATPTYPFPLGSTVQDTTHATSTTLGSTLYYPGQTETSEITITDDGSVNAGDLDVYMPSCTQATTPGAPTETNPTNPCSAGAQFYVEEVNSGGTALECWYPTDVNGACTPSDVTVSLAPTLSTAAAITALPVAALTAAVNSGDSVKVTSGTHNQTFTASAAAAIGATSISVTSATPNFAYPTGSTVADQSRTSNTTLTPLLSTASPLTSLPVTALGASIPAGDAVTVSSIGTTFPITSLPVSGLNGAIASGDQILVQSGADEQTFTASAAASSGASSISIGSATPNFGYLPGATIIDTSATLGTGAAITSLAVAPLASAVTTGDSITVTSGGNNQTFTASANAAVGATSIPVTSATPNFAYPEASTVADTTNAGSTWLVPVSASLNDKNATFTVSATAASGATTISVDSQTPNFAYPGDSFVADTTYTDSLGTFAANYNASDSSLDLGAGPTVGSLSTSAAITKIPVAGLSTAVTSGDSIKVTSGSNTQTFTASATAAVGATSISVTSATPNFAYPTGSTVADTTHTGSTTLTPTSRYFIIGMRLPTTSSNSLQGQMGEFTLGWYVSS